MRRLLALAFLATTTLAPLAAQDSRMTPELLWRLGRVSAGALSPDGKSVAYTVRRYDLAENRGDSDLYLVDVESGRSRRLTDGPESESAVQWLSTSKGPLLLFLSKRSGDDATQAWSLDPARGELRRVTDVEGGIGNLVVSPSGDRIAFTREIKLDATVRDLYPDLPKADARIIDGLMYRHWDSWHDHRYSHLHVAPLREDGTAGPAVDLMKGLRVDCPVPPFGGSEQFSFSPDGRRIAFTMKAVADWARSTDSDVYVVDSDGEGARVCVSEGMNGYDNDPVWTPDGRYLLFHSMERPGFESDRNRVMRYDPQDGSIVELTTGLDQTVHGARPTPDGRALYFASEWRGCDHLFRLDLRTNDLKQVTAGPHNWALHGIFPDGETLLVGRQDMIRPWEIGTLPAEGGDFRALTDVNGEVYAGLEVPKVEERRVRASDGKWIHCWVILPPDFDPSKTWPMITYFQGGPQGQIGQWFSYRWNFHLMASRGYVVLAPNRRGLPGFGRQWNDEISGDWGGQAMRDILAAHDALALEPWVDADRCAGVGASYGGYTAYWMMGNSGDRFSAMIAHCGVFNLESMYGSTEELFFVDWDLGGPYWKSRELQRAYDAFSPNRFVGNWKTPLLVVHGEKDFRVPVTQGMEAFTAAQVEGVPSRFLYFPEEGHWVLGPQNGVLWHRVFFDWLARWTAGKGR